MTSLAVLHLICSHLGHSLVSYLRPSSMQQQADAAEASDANPACVPAPAPSAPSGNPVPPPQLSLVAALLDCPTVDGFYAPTSGLPDAWLLAFERHADAAVLLGLFQSCCAGWALALKAADTARLTIQLTEQQMQGDAWLRQLAAAQSALHKRGALPTQVTVSTDIRDRKCSKDSVAGAAAAQHLVRLLTEAGQHISTLTLQIARGHNQPAFFGQLLQRAAAGLSNLTTLHIAGTFSVIPTPAQLPQLRAVHVTLPDAGGFAQPSEPDFASALHSSLRAHLPTLTTLGYKGHDPVFGALWLASLLRSAKAHSRSLTELITNLDLDKELLGLITKRLPELKRLTVSGVQIGPPQAGKQWGLQRLCIEPLYGEREIGMHTLVSLLCLPQSSAGRVCVESSCDIVVDVTVIRAATLLLLNRHLQRFTYEVKSIILRAESESSLGAGQLPAVLSGLQTFLAPGAPVVFYNWPWTSELTAAVAAALPTLTHLSLAVHLDRPLTDELLGWLLQLGPHVRSVRVKGLDLQSDQHSAVAWPWEELVCEEGVNVGSLANLPDPCGGVRVVTTSAVVLSRALSEDVCARLQARLPHIRFKPQGDSALVVQFKHQVDVPAGTRHAQIIALRILRFDRPETEREAVLRLVGRRPEDADGTDSVQALPAWRCTLDLSAQPSWLDVSDDSCRQVASLVPTSYHTWVLPASVDEASIGSLVEGVSEARRGRGLAALQLRRMGGWQGGERVMDEHVCLS